MGGGLELHCCDMAVMTDGLNAVEAQNAKLYRQIHVKQLCTENEFSQHKPAVKNWEVVAAF